MKKFSFLNKDFLKDLIVEKEYSFDSIKIDKASAQGAYYSTLNYDIGLEGYDIAEIRIKNWSQLGSVINIYTDTKTTFKAFASAQLTVGNLQLIVRYIRKF